MARVSAVTEHVPGEGGDPKIDNHAARRNTGRMVGLVAAVVVTVEIGVVLVAPGAPGGRPRYLPASIIIIIIVGSCVVLSASAVVMYRRPSWRAVMQYGWRRRSRVGKALRRGRPITEQDWPVATAMMHLVHRQRWLPYFYSGVIVLWVINGLSAHGLQRWSGLGLAGLFVVLTPYSLWQRRRLLTNYNKQLAIHNAQPHPPDDPTTDTTP